jgi:hypothetical protein
MWFFYDVIIDVHLCKFQYNELIKKIVTKDIGFGTGYDEDDLLEYMEGEASVPISKMDKELLDKYKNKMKDYGLN